MCSSEIKTLTVGFIYLLLGGAVMFLLAVGLTEPFQKMVTFMNDRNQNQSLRDWLIAGSLSLFFGFIWCGAYLTFKAGEKKILDYYFSRAPKKI